MEKQKTKILNLKHKTRGRTVVAKTLGAPDRTWGNGRFWFWNPLSFQLTGLKPGLREGRQLQQELEETWFQWLLQQSEPSSRSHHFGHHCVGESWCRSQWCSTGTTWNRGWEGWLQDCDCSALSAQIYRSQTYGTNKYFNTPTIMFYSSLI